MKRIVFVLLCFFVLLIGCKKGEKEGDKGQEVGAAQGDVVATVGGSTITLKEFETKFGSIPPQFMGFFAGEEGKKKFLQEIVTEKLLVEKAKALGIDKQPEVKEMINDMTSNILAREIYNSKSQELAAAAKVSDEEVDSEIKNNTIARASHILVKDEAKAQGVLKRIKKGEAFEKVASEVSEDQSAKRNNGDLGTFARGERLPEFDSAIFVLKAGEVGPAIVKTNVGFHIVKRTEIDKNELKNILNRKKQSKLFQQWMDGLKTEIQVKVNDEVLSKAKVGGEGMMPGMPGGHPAIAPQQQQMPAGH